MLLAIDIGNSKVALGILADEKLQATFIEHPDAEPTQRVPEERDVQPARKLPPDVVKPIREALDGCNQQADKVRAWGALIRPIIPQD